MPPKVRITKEDIIRAALEITRQEGADAVNAREIAGRLCCSTQPVFSNFASMEELRGAVTASADALYQQYTRSEIEADKYPAYKAAGMAYIRFAREEKELFRLLFMRDRSGEPAQGETEELRSVYGLLQAGTGLDEDRARLFHLEMWAYVHGIAVMLATGYLELDTELISKMLTDAYQGLKNRYEAEEE